MKYLTPRVTRNIKRRIGLAMTAVGAMASIAVAPVHADTLDSSWNADGDNTSVQVTSVLTEVCLGSSVTINVQGAIHRNSQNAKNVFANNSSVTYEVTVGNGGDTPVGLVLGQWSDTFPSTWVSDRLGTTRQSANVPVSFTPTEIGAGKLHLILRATGTAVDGSSLILTHPVTAKGGGAFSWSAKDCSPPPPEEENFVSLAINSPSLIVNEGQTALNMGSASGTDGVTVTASSGEIVQSDDGTFTWSEYEQDGPSDSKTVTLTAINGKGKSVSDSFSLTVDNVVPTITSTSLNVLPDESVYAVGSPVAVSAKYFDPADLFIDQHTCATVWGDGTTTAGSVVNGVVSWTEGSPTGECTATHNYQVAGVYSVSTTIFDKDGGISQTVNGMVVVYDASAGFVTGGGWINVAVGSDVANPSLSGKGTFGFVSKYLPGRNTPDGNTEFQFHNGKLNFHSSSYTWLVVSGCKSQYRGGGSVNGVDGYGFYVVATDGNTGKCKSSGGVDKFRIKIWNADGVVFDNSKNSSDFLEDSTPQSISGGNIVIHTKG